MTRREESTPVADIAWKNHYNVNENNKEDQRRLAAGQLHETLTDKPTKSSVQAVVPYNLSTGFN